jgi:hypothetical protein
MTVPYWHPFRQAQSSIADRAQGFARAGRGEPF